MPSRAPPGRVSPATTWALVTTRSGAATKPLPSWTRRQASPVDLDGRLQHPRHAWTSPPVRRRAGVGRRRSPLKTAGNVPCRTRWRSACTRLGRRRGDVDGPVMGDARAPAWRAGQPVPTASGGVSSQTPPRAEDAQRRPATGSPGGPAPRGAGRAERAADRQADGLAQHRGADQEGDGGDEPDRDRRATTGDDVGAGTGRPPGPRRQPGPRRVRARKPSRYPPTAAATARRTISRSRTFTGAGAPARLGRAGSRAEVRKPVCATIRWSGRTDWPSTCHVRCSTSIVSAMPERGAVERPRGAGPPARWSAGRRRGCRPGSALRGVLHDPPGLGQVEHDRGRGPSRRCRRRRRAPRPGTGARRPGTTRRSAGPAAAKSSRSS